MKNRKLIVGTLPLLLAAAAFGQGPSQTPFYDVKGDRVNEMLGSALAAVGDHDGDGAEDLLVGAPSTSAPNATGRAFLVSGADGSLIRTFAGDTRGDRFGFSVARAGDVNADGRPDLLVGVWGSGQVYQLEASALVFSGLDGSVLHRFQFPAGHGPVESVAGGGDMDGDGHDDIIVGLPRAMITSALDLGAVYVFSGADGGVIHSLFGTGRLYFGGGVAMMGDADGDGGPDFAVSAILDETVGPFAGKVTLHSGADASVIQTLLPPTDSDLFGWSLASAGDVNGDGRCDLVVGTPEEEKNQLPANVVQGSVRVFSGRDGSLLHLVWGPEAQDRLGTSVAAGGDVDGDGVGDLIAGMPGQGPGFFPPVGGRALLLSGRTGATIRTYKFADTSFGSAVALLRDVNGDGRADPVVAAPLESAVQKDAGRVNVYVGGCSLVTKHCEPGVSQLGCRPTLSTTGQPSATKTSGFSVTASRVDGGRSGLAYFGVNGRQAVPFQGGSGFQCVVPPVRVTAAVSGGGTVGQCNGSLTIDLNDHWNVQRPGSDPGAGTQVQLQFLVRGGPNLFAVLSDTIELTLCP